MKLTDISTIRELLGGEQTFFKKKFGQNFLINESVVEKIAESCENDPDTGVLEIGPGIGTLTQKLCKRYKKVVSVEIDRSLVPILEKTMAEFDNFALINNDILKVDLKKLCEENFAGCSKIAVCANLPYYITSQIIMSVLESQAGFSSVTVMVQKEVADRLCSSPGSADYGAVTAAVSYYGKASKILGVGAGNFIPAPKVDSAVVRIELFEEKPVCPKDEKIFFRTVKAAFGQRRKTLLNALKSGFPELSGEEAAKVLTDSGIVPSVRGETLGVADFAKIADGIYGVITENGGESGK